MSQTGSAGCRRRRPPARPGCRPGRRSGHIYVSHVDIFWFYVTKTPSQTKGSYRNGPFGCAGSRTIGPLRTHSYRVLPGDAKYWKRREKCAMTGGMRRQLRPPDATVSRWRKRWLRSPMTGSKGSSGTTASWCPGRTPICTCSATACITRAPCSRASAPMAARSSSRTEHAERLKRSAKILDFEIPYSVAEIVAAKQLVRRQERQEGSLCPPGRLARLGDDGRLGAEQHHPSRHRLVGMAELFRSRAAAQGHQARPRRISPARSEDRAVPRQGRRPLHDLHHLQARAPSAKAMPTP